MKPRSGSVPFHEAPVVHTKPVEHRLAPPVYSPQPLALAAHSNPIWSDQASPAVLAPERSKLARVQPAVQAKGLENRPAPPVYRPQPLAPAAQPKPVRNVAPTAAARTLHTPQAASTPGFFKPLNVPPTVQAKVFEHGPAPPAYRSNALGPAHAVQPLPAVPWRQGGTIAPRIPPAAPRVATRAPIVPSSRPGSIQRMEDEMDVTSAEDLTFEGLVALGTSKQG
jgi:hypothetical protein